MGSKPNPTSQSSELSHSDSFGKTSSAEQPDPLESLLLEKLQKQREQATLRLKQLSQVPQVPQIPFLNKPTSNIASKESDQQNSLRNANSASTQDSVYINIIDNGYLQESYNRNDLGKTQKSLHSVIDDPKTESRIPINDKDDQSSANNDYYRIVPIDKSSELIASDFDGLGHNRLKLAIVFDSSADPKDSNKSSLVSLSTIIKYTDSQKKSGRKKKGIQDLARQTLATMEIRKKECSFKHLLSDENLSKESQLLFSFAPGDIDDPLLDNGLIQRTMLGLPGMIGSIFQFSHNPSLAGELNERFALKHYELNAVGLSIAKIRKTKSLLASTCRLMRLEPSSLALCFAYYEKLLLRFENTLKSKDSEFCGIPLRDLIQIGGGSFANTFSIFGAICLLLSMKINDPYPVPLVYQTATLLSRNLMINRKLIYEYEFFVFSALEFGLFIPNRQFMPFLYSS
ncbi:hypothetical protein BB560_002435 [Smittium megazygosporum]|uniref:Cyclin N-terminal domain-containing protein n=1 Tax=Smittium megazygosporum TaxID=133381 RepID=A0A2T9ZET8_9FUNG|nr:hypothetical protein BB560_002435 [Smittium megazygosporum]